MRLVRTLVLVLSFACLVVPALADFQAGTDANNREDFATALREWRPLAEKGDALAQYNLGVLYRHGEGVPRDFIRAHMWYSVAAASTSGDDGKIAVKNRDNLASQMTAAQIAQAQEMARRCQGTKFKECD